MNKLCDICWRTPATLCDKITINGKEIIYYYCDNCYKGILADGLNPKNVACQRISRKGYECISCGCVVEDFKKTLLFGCPNCYRNMKLAVDDFLYSNKNMRKHIGKNSIKSYPSVDLIKTEKPFEYKNANECSEEDITCFNVLSSRIRLARNFEGYLFPNTAEVSMETVELINRVYEIASSVANVRTYTISSLSKEQKMILVERNLVSLNLVNSNKPGAVILEENSNYGLSIMLNEEDFIREQFICSGLNLKYAFSRLNEIDNLIIQNTNIAFDNQYGFLTACPTNLRTGMRASTMIFLPALCMSRKIDETLQTIKQKYDLTIRGIFGEGTETDYDCYQLSNAHTLGKKEEDIIYNVEEATKELCFLERCCLDQLLLQNKNEIYDKVSRSYALLSSAYSLSLDEFRENLVNVKLGVILNILPLKNIDKIDELIYSTSDAYLTLVDPSEDDKDATRAMIVKKALIKESQ